MNQVRVCKIFTFDAAHQLEGHKGKCANVHGHTYKLEVIVSGVPITADNPAEEGFVMDFGDIKEVVKEKIVDVLDHSFLAMGNEPGFEALRHTGSKISQLGFRTTAENLCLFICHTLRSSGLPMYSVRVWETPTSYAEVLAAEIPVSGPVYRTVGVCDIG